MAHYDVPAFLAALLHARSPSGYEFEAQKVFDEYVKPAADEYANDALGNRLATLHPGGELPNLDSPRADLLSGLEGMTLLGEPPENGTAKQETKP